MLREQPGKGPRSRVCLVMRPSAQGTCVIDQKRTGLKANSRNVFSLPYIPLPILQEKQLALPLKYILYPTSFKRISLCEG